MNLLTALERIHFADHALDALAILVKAKIECKASCLTGLQNRDTSRLSFDHAVERVSGRRLNARHIAILDRCRILPLSQVWQLIYIPSD